MSSPAVQEEQLLELLLTLKKTTPEQAKEILSVQPQIAYALMAVMVNLGAINVEVTQKTLTAFSSGTGSAAGAGLSASLPPPGMPPAARPPSTQPMAAIPPHMAGPSSSRSATPPQYRDPRSNTPQYPTGPRGATSTYPPTAPAYPAHHAQQYPPTMPPAHNPYGGPPGPPPQMNYGGPPSLPPGVRPEVFANLPEDQKPIVLSILHMTPEQVAHLPPNDRASIVQLRQTLGLPQ